MMEIQALIKVIKHCWRMRNGWLRVISSFPIGFSKDGLIDCMVFNTVYNSISVILQRPVHLSILSWVVLTITPHNVLSKALAAFPHNHCRNNGQQWERNELCRNDCHQSSERIWPCRGSNQRPPVLESPMVPTELWGLTHDIDSFWKQMFLIN